MIRNYPLAAILLIVGTGVAPARNVTIAYSGWTIAEMPFASASRKGSFQEANLDVKMIYMSTNIANLALRGWLSKESLPPIVPIAGIVSYH